MKRALVISGGGSKGAFAVGVLRRLLERFPALEFDIFVGTSTGSLIVPLAALGEWDLLEEIYTSQREGSVVRKLRIGDRLNTESLFDATPLWELIHTHFGDGRYAELAASGKKMYINTVCLQTGELTVFTNDESTATQQRYTTRSFANAAHFRRAIMASACQPVFMPPIQVNRDLPGHPEKEWQYVDGGLREYAGIEMAIDAGAREIFTILLSPESPDSSAVPYRSILPLLERTIDIFTTDVAKNDLIIPGQYNEALQYIEAVKRKMVNDGVPRETVNRYFTIRGRESPWEDKVPLKLFTIRPETALGGGPGGLDFDPVAMRAMVKRGARSADLFSDNLRPGDISWA